MCLKEKKKKSVFSGTVYFIRAVFVCVCVSVCLNSGAEVWLNASRVWRQINAITFLSPSSAKRNQLRHALVIYVGEAWANGRCAAWIFFFRVAVACWRPSFFNMLFTSLLFSPFLKKNTVSHSGLGQNRPSGNTRTQWAHGNNQTTSTLNSVASHCCRHLFRLALE